MKIKIISDSPKETQKIAYFFIEAILPRTTASRMRGKKQYCPQKNGGLVISLEGPLGGGKTEFLKGVAKFLKLEKKIFSPTFLIMKSFPCKTRLFDSLWHLDCYRIKRAKEIKELDFLEIIKNPKNLVFIEWGDKIKKLLPAKHWKIKFKIAGKNTRILIFDIH